MFTSREEIVKKVKWNGEDGVVELEFFSGTHWHGMERKDLFCPEEDWHSRIKTGTKMLLWSLQYSRVAGAQVWDKEKGEWMTAWYVDNHFQTRQERRETEAGYENCIWAAAAQFAWMVDDGDDIKKAWKKITSSERFGITGYQAGCIMNIAAQRSKHGEAIRVWWNAEHGETSGEGVVNPAILEMKCT